MRLKEVTTWPQILGFQRNYGTSANSLFSLLRIGAYIEGMFTAHEQYCIITVMYI